MPSAEPSAGPVLVPVGAAPVPVPMQAVGYSVAGPMSAAALMGGAEVVGVQELVAVPVTPAGAGAGVGGSAVEARVYAEHEHISFPGTLVG